MATPSGSISRNKGAAFGALVLCGLTTLASAQGLPVGVVKNANGAMAVAADGRERSLKPGDPVFVGDKVRTGVGGAVAATLRDDSRVAMAPNTSLRIKGFNYDANKQEGSMVLGVLRGTLVFVSGALTKSSTDAVRVDTPTTTAGIRGTEFIVEVEGGSDD